MCILCSKLQLLFCLLLLLLSRWSVLLLGVCWSSLLHPQPADLLLLLLPAPPWVSTQALQERQAGNDSWCWQPLHAFSLCLLLQSVQEDGTNCCATHQACTGRCFSRIAYTHCQLYWSTYSRIGHVRCMHATMYLLCLYIQTSPVAVKAASSMLLKLWTETYLSHVCLV